MFVCFYVCVSVYYLILSTIKCFISTLSENIRDSASKFKEIDYEVNILL